MNDYMLPKEKYMFYPIYLSLRMRYFCDLRSCDFGVFALKLFKKRKNSSSKNGTLFLILGYLLPNYAGPPARVFVSNCYC